MGSMHGELLVDEESALESIFAEGDRWVAVRAEDQEWICDHRAALKALRVALLPEIKINSQKFFRIR
jgi:hypothetical protein